VVLALDLGETGVLITKMAESELSDCTSTRSAASAA